MPSYYKPKQFLAQLSSSLLSTTPLMIFATQKMKELQNTKGKGGELVPQHQKIIIVEVCILHNFEQNQLWGATSMMWQSLNGYERIGYTIQF